MKTSHQSLNKTLNLQKDKKHMAFVTPSGLTEEGTSKTIEAGGMTVHYHDIGEGEPIDGGLRSGWVDQPQDEWFLQQMHDGNAAALSSMFSFRSELFNSGAGEMRTWIVVAAAMDFMKPGHKAEWSDYIPTRKLTNGSGWVLYPPISNEEVEARRGEVLAAV